MTLARDVIFCVKKGRRVSVGSASQEEPNPMKRRLTPHEESNTDHGAVPTFCAGPEGDVLGRPVGEDAAGLERFQRRAEEVMLLIREAFLRGISTRQVGRVVAILTGEAVSAQTVSKLSRHLDRLVKAFQQAPALVKNFVSERFILRSRIVTERWR